MHMKYLPPHYDTRHLLNIYDMSPTSAVRHGNSLSAMIPTCDI